jgi:hypothetical protein
LKGTSVCRVSFVVTSRNDDHGGHMLGRFGIFADGLLEQATRHGLTGELIVVEWNPLPGPRLHEALKLRNTSDTFPVRFIEVPPEAHRPLRNSDTIPLFQMLAKNVGIRRARGEFVVATNPDILFSDALVSFLAAGNLRPDTLYRLDRHDVAADVPESAGIEEQLSWCARHVLRIHRRTGTIEPRTGGRGLLVAGAYRKLVRWTSQAGARVAQGVRSWHHDFFDRLPYWRPWQVGKTVRALGRGLRRLVRVLSYLLLPRRVRAALDRGAMAHGQHRLRHAMWLASKSAFGPPRVHTNGCGDFTMLARPHWFALRGYPELPLWSMHMDSFLCFMSVAAGLREQVLTWPSAMFHMEHERSWVVMTPEERLRTFALKPWIDIGLLSDLWEDAYAARRPILFNDEQWGLADWGLREVLLLSGEKQVVMPASPLVPVLVREER